ncbi:MAG: HAMP domain-containing protein, partial [Burkholderiales bacterium]
MTRHWQERYIAGNPYPVGAKDNLVTHKDGTAYDTAHALYHPQFRRMIQRFGYYDLFLIDARSGHIVYTVFKETDYATRLGDGPYRGSNLAELFSRALKSPATEFCELVDYRPYSPSYAAPAAFIAAPIYDGVSKIGVLAVQVPIDEINRVMTGERNWRREGLGESGETYLVGDDFLMRSDSRFLIEDPEGFHRALAEFKRPQSERDAIRRLGTTILTLPVKSDAAQDALLGNTGTRIIRDYRDIPVLSSYAPLNIPGLHWVLLSEIDESEDFAPVAALRQRVLLAGLALVLPVLGLGALLAGGFARPAKRLLAGVERVRRGELDQRIEVGSRDELGQLTASFNAMAAELQQTTVSKDYVDSVFRSMNDALLIAERQGSDAELAISDANPHALRVLQRSRTELIGQSLSRVLQAEGEVATWTAERTPLLIANAQQRAVEGRLLPRETAPIPVLISLSAVNDETGALKRLVAVAHDITEQKQAQEALTRANALKDAFLANT